MQAIALDIRTLSFITMSIAFFFSAGLFVFGLSQKKFKGIPLLAAASAAYAFGLLLLGYRDILSPFITIIVANTSLIFGLVLYFEGIRRFLNGSDTIHPLSYIALVSHIVLFVLFTYKIPSVNYRVISISVTAGLLCFYCAREFFGDFPPYWKAPGYMLKIIYVGYGMYHLLRIYLTVGEGKIESFMSAGNIHAFAFIFIIFLVTGNTFGFIWMVSKKFENELTELAELDDLTQILNRRGVKAFADREFLKMQRIGTNLSVIMADIDYLKDINDHFGHQVGDLAIQKFTELTQQIIRPYDIFGRIGGDEFVIVLPNTTKIQSSKIANRIRDHVQSHPLQAEGEIVKLSASFGVAHSNMGVNTFDELASFADQALYQSKNNGRNQVTDFDALITK